MGIHPNLFDCLYAAYGCRTTINVCTYVTLHQVKLYKLCANDAVAPIVTIKETSSNFSSKAIVDSSTRLFTSAFYSAIQTRCIHGKLYTIANVL